jgi:hypothetical protein
MNKKVLIPLIIGFVVLAISLAMFSFSSSSEMAYQGPDTIGSPPPSAPDNSDWDTDHSYGSPNGDSYYNDSAMPKFQWPPPAASATYVIRSLQPDQELAIYTLGDLDNFLLSILDETGYVERSYFAVPDGYALVTRLERIYDDGRVVTENRWSINDTGLTEFSFRDYIQKLFFAEPGLFRVVVFVISPRPFTQSDDNVTQEEALAWLQSGYNVFPQELARRTLTTEYNITALIYQFEKAENRYPVLVERSNITGQQHLEAAGILNFIY